MSQLLAPIALYPDALLGIILPASTVPTDIVLASRYLDNGGNLEEAKSQSWDESVLALTRYPDVLGWMNENLDWTASLGEAFVIQPDDVMSAIQLLRARANAAGNLVSNPQQTVENEDGYIRVIPADPQTIYVPVYQTELVYVQPNYMMSFGAGYAVGRWMAYDCDWSHRRVYRGNWCGWSRRENHRPPAGVNRANVCNIDAATATPWNANASVRTQIAHRQQSGFQPHVVTPTPRTIVPPSNVSPDSRANRQVVNPPSTRQIPGTGRQPAPVATPHPIGTPNHSEHRNPPPVVSPPSTRQIPGTGRQPAPVATPRPIGTPSHAEHRNPQQGGTAPSTRQNSGTVSQPAPSATPLRVAPERRYPLPVATTPPARQTTSPTGNASYPTEQTHRQRTSVPQNQPTVTERSVPSRVTSPVTMPAQIHRETTSATPFRPITRTETVRPPAAQQPARVPSVMPVQQERQVNRQQTLPTAQSAPSHQSPRTGQDVNVRSGQGGARPSPTP